MTTAPSTTMRAFPVEEFGAPGSVQHVPVPSPGEGEILIRIRVARVNVIETYVLTCVFKDRMERRFPHLLTVHPGARLAALTTP